MGSGDALNFRVGKYEATTVSHRPQGAGVGRPFGAGIIFEPVYITSRHFTHGGY